MYFANRLVYRMDLVFTQSIAPKSLAFLQISFYLRANQARYEIDLGQFIVE